MIVRNRISIMLALFIAGCFFASTPLLLSSDTKDVKYVCPMHPEEVSDGPDQCSICGMDLVKKDEAPANQNVAILIFDGVQIIDFTAPYEILGQEHFNVYTVAPTADPIVTSMNLRVAPAYTIDNAPTPFILVIPGGDIDQAVEDPKVIRWIRETTKTADHVLSVCNGAFFLAKAGLLDGLTATTFHRLIPALREAAPKTKVVTDKKFVDNGKIITSAGLSSGIEGSLHLISKIFGMEKAKELALHLEYNWQPDSKYARANLADKYIADVDIGSEKISDWHQIKNVGGLNDWIIQGTVKSEVSPVDVLKMIQDQLVKEKKWSVQSSNGLTQCVMGFTDEEGRTWSAHLSAEKISGEANRLMLTLKIDRKS